MDREKSEIGFGLGLIAGVIGGILAGIAFAPCPGEEMRKKVKNTVCDLAEKHSPAINDAKHQAMESIDLIKYRLEKQYKKFSNMLKNKKLQKAKELEENNDDYDFN